MPLGTGTTLLLGLGRATGRGELAFSHGCRVNQCSEEVVFEVVNLGMVDSLPGCDMVEEMWVF